MSSRFKAAITATAIGCAGLGAFAATVWGEDPPASPEGAVRAEIVRPAMEPSAPAIARQAPQNRKKAKRPKINNLITSGSVPVAAGESVVAELKCKKSQGIPLDGGAIAPPAPAQVAISVISRFNPNPPFEAPAQSFYVGVRNLSPTDPAEFRATLTCAKGMDQ